MDERTDLELVEACRQHGDQKAFSTLVKRYERPIYNFILKMVSIPAVAEELFQEAFLRIYQNLHNFRGGAAFSPWAYRIAYNLCVDELRSPRGRLFVPLEPSSPGFSQQERSFDERMEGKSPDPADELYRKELAQRIQEAVMNLPVKFRSVFVLYQYQHLPYEEIANTLEIPIGTVKSRMHAALKQLSHALRDLSPNPRSS